MRKPYTRISDSIVRLALLLLFLCCSMGIALVLYPHVRAGAWDDTFVFMVESNVSLPEVQERLQQAGISVNVSSLTQQVQFSRFDGLETIALSALAERIDFLDPRLDPYLRSLTNYFHTAWQGRDYHIFYLPARQKPFFTSLVLSSVFRDCRWMLPETHRTARLLSFILFVAFAVLIIIRSRSIWGCAVSIPWILGFWCGDYGFIFAAFAGFWSWTHIIVEIPEIFTYYLNYGTLRIESDRLIRYLYLLVVSVCITALAIPLGWYTREGAALAFAAHGLSLFITGIQGLICLWKHRSRAHRLFFLVSILNGGRHRADSGNIIDRLAPFAAILLLPLFISFSGSNGPSIPLPAEYKEVQDMSWESLARLRLLRSESDLPDMSDFLAHRAYQESMLFGGEYRFPNRGDSVMLPFYTWEDGKVVSHRKTMVEFTEGWYRDIMKDIPTEGILAMLSARGRFLSASRDTPRFLPDTPFFFASHIACCCFMLFPLFVQMRLHSYLAYGVRNILVRRKRQAA